jgi:uncharacterized LabA/DUF88 family protein
MLIDGGWLQAAARRIDVALDVRNFVFHVFNMVSNTGGLPEMILSRVTYYDSQPWAKDKRDREEMRRVSQKRQFHDKLALGRGWRVRLGETMHGTGTDGEDYKRQKGVDTLITIDMIVAAIKRQCDVVILVAGDNDFVPAMEKARDEGLLVVLVFGDGNDMATLTLQKAADVCVLVRSETMKSFAQGEMSQVPDAIEY